MCKLNLTKLQAADFILKNLQDKNTTDIKLVILYDSKLVYGDFLINDIRETNFKQYSLSEPDQMQYFYLNEFDNRFLTACLNNIKRYIYNSFFYNKEISNFEVILENILDTINSTEYSLNDYDRTPRPVMYNACFMESNITLPFIQLDAEKEYTLVSLIDTKSL